MSPRLFYYSLLRNLFFYMFKLFAGVESSLYRKHVRYHKLVQGLKDVT